MQNVMFPKDADMSKISSIKIFSKQNLIDAFVEIKEMGWIPNARPGNQGGIGNTLEDLLGVEENNLPIPNAAEWELKTQRASLNSLTTLFHMEPSPRAVKFVPQLLLPSYGWSHKEAGSKYPDNEMSFRQTITAINRTSRGFLVIVDEENRKVKISFDANSVSEENKDWLDSVEERIGLGELNPQPYWGFDDLFHKAGTKLLNTFYILADRKRMEGVEHFHYSKLFVLQNLSMKKFIESFNAGDTGNLLVDFDARTGHNHGTKFRLRPLSIIDLYDVVTEY